MICSRFLTVSDDIRSSGNDVNWLEIYKNHWNRGPAHQTEKFIPHLHQLVREIVSSKLSVRIGTYFEEENLSCERSEC
jgi:hypothetical protein